MNVAVDEGTAFLGWQPFHKIPRQCSACSLGTVEGMKDCLNGTMTMRENFEGLIIGSAEHLGIVEGLLSCFSDC